MHLLLNRSFKLLKNSKILRSFNLNFGPQHPSSHGVLRLVLELDNELITKIDPHIGFLHRGSEKLLESCNLYNGSVFTDRLDYTSILTQSHAYCLAVESSSIGFTSSLKTILIRTIFDELSRIMNHLLSLATHALDIGTMATLFWAFEDRERIMELFEYISGARMHAAIYFPEQCLDSVFTDSLLLKLILYLKSAQKDFTEMFIALYNNRVWKLRLCGIGRISYNFAKFFGVSGPVARSSGLLLDYRINSHGQYGFYSNIQFSSFVGVNGDSYDRFLIRCRELFESTKIIYSCLSELFIISKSYFINTGCHGSHISLKLESLITSFKVAEGGSPRSTQLTYGSVESGKGLFSIFIVLNSGLTPYRVFIRSPAFAHLQLIPILCSGHFIADIPTILGTIDVVFGEVDR
jgi:NADH-quinone oxidoreductase subunit D